MRRLASWSFNHRRIVVVAWLAAFAIFFGISRAVGTGYSNNFTLPSTESTQALELLQAAAPQESGDTEQIVIGTSGGAKVTDPDVQQRVQAMLAKVAELPHVVGVLSPYAPEGARQVSPDGTVAFATVALDRQAQNLSIPYAKDFVGTATAASGDGVVVAVSGQLAQWANEPAIGGTGLGILTAGIVLFLVFGSLFAMAMPLASALVALGTAIQVIGLVSNVMKMPEFSTELVMLIGLGVGVDYALFIVSRHRQGLQAGRDPGSSVELAMDTSGRAVLFAGTIVCVALLGMFALGISFLFGIAVAASIGVLFTMVAALTFLPAMLGFVGPKILSRRQRRSAHGRRTPLGDEGRVLGPVVEDRRAAPGAVGCAGPRAHRRPRGAVLQLAPRPVGPGQRPEGHDHSDLVRPAGLGVRSGVQRAAPARRRDDHARAGGGHAAARDDHPGSSPGSRR